MKPLIWIIGGPVPDWPVPARLRAVNLPLPKLADIPAQQRPQGCLCMDSSLLPQLTTLPCPVWGYGFWGLEGCLADNWAQFMAACATLLNPGGWREAIHLCVPLSYLWDERQKFINQQVARLRLNVELGLDSQALDVIIPKHFDYTKKLLQHARVNVHMPFMDLHPGAMDALIAKASLQRLRQAAKVALAFNAKRAVFHLGYDPRLNRETDLFVDTVSKSLAPVMRRLQRAGCLPVIENVFEPEPTVILAVRQRLADLNGGQVGLCLDVGHANAFNRYPLLKWWQEFCPYIAELHLHDNPGHDDTHEAIGSGNIDFAALGEQIKQLKVKPVFTLELRSEEALWRSLRELNRLWGPVAELQ